MYDNTTMSYDQWLTCPHYCLHHHLSSAPISVIDGYTHKSTTQLQSVEHTVDMTAGHHTCMYASASVIICGNSSVT